MIEQSGSFLDHCPRTDSFTMKITSEDVARYNVLKENDQFVSHCCTEFIAVFHESDFISYSLGRLMLMSETAEMATKISRVSSGKNHSVSVSITLYLFVTVVGNLVTNFFCGYVFLLTDQRKDQSGQYNVFNLTNKDFREPPS